MGKINGEQLEWLKANYSNTANSDLCKHLNISATTLHKYARLFKLKKSEEFMQLAQTEATRLARIANARRGYPPKGYKVPNREKGCFKKGVNSLMRIGAEREAERLRNVHEKRNASIKSDRLRIKWGLEQKTKMKLNGTFKYKSYVRWTMRKRGYEIEKGGDEAIVTDCTQRSERFERNCGKCGIRIVIR